MTSPVVIGSSVALWDEAANDGGNLFALWSWAPGCSAGIVPKGFSWVGGWRCTNVASRLNRQTAPTEDIAV